MDGREKNRPGKERGMTDRPISADELLSWLGEAADFADRKQRMADTGTH